MTTLSQPANSFDIDNRSIQIHHTKDIVKEIENMLPKDTKEISYNVKIPLKIENNVDVTAIVDLIIEDKSGMKLYVDLKGSNTFPASISDVAMLKSIREKDRKDGKKQHRYMIFCEEENNDTTKKLARGFNINYVNHEKYLKPELRGYFNDVK